MADFSRSAQMRPSIGSVQPADSTRLIEYGGGDAIRVVTRHRESREGDSPTMFITSTVPTRVKADKSRDTSALKVSLLRV
jgi:hypothetical protein